MDVVWLQCCDTLLRKQFSETIKTHGFCRVFFSSFFSVCMKHLFEFFSKDGFLVPKNSSKMSFENYLPNKGLSCGFCRKMK